MRKINSTNLLTFILLVAFGLTAGFKVSAQAVDLGDLKPGVTYDIPEFKEVTGAYTPGVTGPVKFVWTCSPLTLYSSSDYAEESIVEGSHAYTGGGQMMSYPELEAGKTYYIYSSMTIMSGTLTIQEGETPLEVSDIEPNPNSGNKFSISRNYRIYVTFNYPVTVGNCHLAAGSNRVPVSPVVSNTTLSLDVNDVVMKFYHEGSLQEGSAMTLNVTDIKDAMNPDVKYNGNGELQVDFVMAAKPAELTSTRGFSVKGGSNVFNSYYFADDENGKMSLTFDRALSTSFKPQVNLAFGDPDNVDLIIYTETLTGVVDGNTATFDFTGKLRRRVDMLPGVEEDDMPTQIYVSFSNICTDDLQWAYTGQLSNPNSFATSMTVNDLMYNIAADFSPARGAGLVPGSAMEIWVMNGKYISYDEICLDYTRNGKTETVKISKNNVSEQQDPDSATGEDMLFIFTIPEYDADDNTPVNLYMSNLVCADGLDHANDVRGEFNSAKSGVGAIGVGTLAETGDVFDIAGRMVMRSANRSDLQNLDKGIYIFNNKKINIK